MTPADFEITAWLTAGELRTHIPPDAQLETMSGGGTFIRGEAQSRAREAVERTGCSRDVIVEKRVVAAVGVGVIGDNVQKQLSRGQ